MASKNEQTRWAVGFGGWAAALAIAAAGVTPAPSVAQSAAAGMSRAEATALYNAAGYRIDGDQPVNRCGRAARPKLSFVDINADRRPEALFVDTDPECFAPDGRSFVLLVRGASGWWVVADGNGSIEALATRTGGWLDMRITSAGCVRPYRFNGRLYAPAGECGEAIAAAAPQQPAVPPPSTQSPAPPPTRRQAQSQPPMDTPPPVMPQVAAAPAAGTKLSAADEAAAFQAAGFRKRRGQWRSDCDDPGTATYTPGVVEQAGDFNGDGRPDAVLTEGGSYCYGNTGTGYWLVSKRADGRWVLMDRNTGILEFAKTRGVDGWPDIVVGGPGFCFPVTRWNGREYKLNRWEYEGKPCRPPR